jgi:predicted small lipoprotein YifL
MVIKNHKIVATVLALSALLMVLISLAACGSSPAPATAPPVNAPASTGTSSSAFLSWYNGTGYSDYQAVSSDISQATTDANNGNVAASETDGSQLAIDAQTAADDPMPIDTTQYVAAMNDYVEAGNDSSTGDFTDATTALEAATSNVNAITTTLNGINNG